MPRTGTCEIRRGREEHRRPKKSDRCIVVRLTARLTKFKSYSRSPGDRGKVFASLPFVRSGVVRRKSEGQMVGWSRATARVSFERSSVPRREVARFHRRGM